MRFYISLLAMPLLATLAATDCNNKQSSGSQSANSVSIVNANQTAAPIQAAENTDNAKRISLADAKKAYDAGTALIVDTRSQSGWQAKHIKNSINMPVDQVATRYKELPQGKQIIFYCS